VMLGSSLRPRSAPRMTVPPVSGGGERGNNIWEGSTRGNRVGVGGGTTSATSTVSDEPGVVGGLNTTGENSSRRRRSSNCSCALSSDDASTAGPC